MPEIANRNKFNIKMLCDCSFIAVNHSAHRCIHLFTKSYLKNRVKSDSISLNGLENLYKVAFYIFFTTNRRRK